LMYIGMVAGLIRSAERVSATVGVWGRERAMWGMSKGRKGSPPCEEGRRGRMWGFWKRWSRLVISVERVGCVESVRGGDAVFVGFVVFGNVVGSSSSLAVVELAAVVAVTRIRARILGGGLKPAAARWVNVVRELVSFFRWAVIVADVAGGGRVEVMGAVLLAAS